MLTYAFQLLRQENYQRVAAEEFEDIQDLFAEILALGVAQQIKQGLYRKYVNRTEEMSFMRGKLDMTGTNRLRLARQHKLSCNFDELSQNNTLNQILKTTMVFLLQDKKVHRKRKIALKKNLVYFDEIEGLQPSAIPWNQLQYQRSNRNYEMLINICYFILHHHLQTTEAGEYKMMDFMDQYMNKLYEKFILEYYRRHHTYLKKAEAAQVKWNLDSTPDLQSLQLLPNMKTDTTLRYRDKTLIIDAKYYGRTLQQYMDKSSVHSGNLYQIFAYVKNEDKDNSGNVGGVLLYAKTQEDQVPDCAYQIGGNRFWVKTLDLNREFIEITRQLDRVAFEFFGKDNVQVS